MSDFLATALGSGLGVIAGVLVQYGVERWLNRDKTVRHFAHIKAEAAYNKSLLEQMVSEETNLRSALSASLMNKYFGYFANGSAFWVALNKFITDSIGYTTFTSTELSSIQKAQRWLSSDTEKWIYGQINMHKQQNDSAEMLNLCNHIQNQCKETISTLDMIISKKL